MFIYLSKKIAIPNGSLLHALAWNPDQGWIACGGESALLKVLKLENTVGQPKKDGAAPPTSNLSMNQTLEGHEDKVICAAWNALYRKLTTSDGTGQIIVWMLHKGMWHEEMVNNRHKSVVRDMKWTSDGTKICIVYEDGAVIVGDVNGNRIWGKELEFQLSLLEWSPDNRFILFVSGDAKVYAYDAMGNRVKKLELPVLEHCQMDAKGKPIGAEVAAISWYDGAEGTADAHAPTLAIALTNGLVQLARSIDDANPVVIDTQLAPLRHCKWDTKGSVLAVAGLRTGGGKYPSVVHFYDALGSFLRTLPVVGGGINALSWEGGGLRIALAVDAYIYFANIRPDYKWVYFADGASVASNLLGTGASPGSSSSGGGNVGPQALATAALRQQERAPGHSSGVVAYAYSKPDRKDTTVMFWDQATDERTSVNVPALRFLAAAGDFCVLVSVDPSASAAAAASDNKGGNGPMKGRGKKGGDSGESKRGEGKDGEEKSSSSSSSSSSSNKSGRNRGANKQPRTGSGLRYKLQLCNAIGTPVDTKALPVGMVPLAVTMTPYHVIVADVRCVYVWQYKTQVLKLAAASSETAADSSSSSKASKASSGMGSSGVGRERVLDCSLAERKVHEAGGADQAVVGAQTLDDFVYPSGGDDDEDDDEDNAVVSVSASSSMLLVGLASGAIQRYSLPRVALDARYELKATCPTTLKLNCDSTMAAMVDNGMLSILDLASGKPIQSPDPNEGGLVRKDAWDLCWASDAPHTLAIMEKTKMVVLDKFVPQDPIVSSGYLASFSALEVKAVLMDEVMAAPDRPNKEHVLSFDTEPLTHVRSLIDTQGCAEAYAHVEMLVQAEASSQSTALEKASSDTGGSKKTNSATSSNKAFQKLWRVVGDAALQALELSTADRALVRCSDYRGIRLVKKLMAMGSEGSKLKQRAEVCAHLGKFDEAETIYREMDRKDLAIDLRVRCGDWFKVASLIQTGGAGDDKLLARALDQIGEHYRERRAYDKAAHYFSQSKQYAKLSDCYYRLGDWNALSRLVSVVPVGMASEKEPSLPLLLDLAQKLEAVGVHQGAVEAYLKAGEPRAAIDCAVILNQWAVAVDLAQQFDYPQIEGLLAKQANALQSKNDHLGAVMLWRRANKSTEAARMLATLAEQVAAQAVDPLRAKKLQVLAALEVERFRKAALTAAQLNGDTTAGGDIAQTTAATLDTLMTLDTAAGGETQSTSKRSAKVLDNAWRGAAAYHYYLLAQRQLYKGQVDDAMKTSMRLGEYDDVLPPRDIYSLIALTAYHNKHYGVCSRAFIKLETMLGLSSAQADQLQTLALAVFTKNSPLDPQALPQAYLDCLEQGAPYSACTASGRLLDDGGRRGTFVCRTCRYPCLERAIQSLTTCPLCHTPLEVGFTNPTKM